MNFLIQYAFSFIGKPYIYGSDDPLVGFDCSGYVEELLLASGEIPFGTPKMNAQAIYNQYAKRGNSVYGTGSLAFFGQDAMHVDHVGFCVDQYLMLEAGGGTAETTSLAAAIEHHAFIKLRPIRYRKDFLCVLKPQYAKMGMI